MDLRATIDKQESRAAVSRATPRAALLDAAVGLAPDDLRP